MRKMSAPANWVLKAARILLKTSTGLNSGGIRDARTALAMIEAGATRIGKSAGVVIVKIVR
jgi:deoxyribose-phosphate aldolase